MKQVTVSIIMPIKNAGPFIEECIDSIIGQTVINWELLAIDDHSGDQSIDLLQKKNDPRIKIYNNRGKGILPALSLGLEKCNGEYITRIDADDKVPFDRLQLMLDYMRSQPEMTIVTGEVEYFSDSPISKGYLTYQRWLNVLKSTEDHWNSIYRECVIASPNWLIRSHELKSYGGFDKLDYPEDYDLSFRWYAFQFNVVKVPRITLYWREHPDRTSRISINYQQEAFFKLKIKRFLELDYKSEKPLVLWGWNKKAQLTARLLESSKKPFHWMSLEGNKSWNGFKIESFQKIEILKNPQLLLAVYPDQTAKDKIDMYLDKLSLKAGRDYWYL